MMAVTVKPIQNPETGNEDSKNAPVGIIGGTGLTSLSNFRSPEKRQ